MSSRLVHGLAATLNMDSKYTPCSEGCVAISALGKAINHVCGEIGNVLPDVLDSMETSAMLANDGLRAGLKITVRTTEALISLSRCDGIRSLHRRMHLHGM